MARKNRIVVVVLCAAFLAAGYASYRGVLSREAEKIIIYLYAIEDAKTVEDFYKVEITNKDDVAKTIRYVTGIPSPGYKCGYQGKIAYYREDGGVLLDMQFNTDCNTVVFVYDDKLYNRRISGRGLRDLKALLENVPPEKRL